MPEVFNPAISKQVNPSGVFMERIIEAEKILTDILIIC
jgi:hypothetical protein